MAYIFHFPSNKELTAEQKVLWDAEMQAILEDADAKAALATAYICDPPSDNPFEQMARERCYNDLKNVSGRMAERKSRVSRKLLVK